jgi:ribosomal protein S12 methylthiotransferase accessory factor
MTKTMILGKDAPLEDSITRMRTLLLELGFDVEEASWLNPVPNVWSVHIRDRFCPYLFTNGKGTTKLAALASALGEFFERLNCNYFFADFYLGQQIAEGEFVHYPQERWFPITGEALPEGLLDDRTRAFYDPHGELKGRMLVETQSGNRERGVCALPFTRQRDNETVWIPMNVVGNLYVSNGMSAGNTPAEARVQCLSEIFERSIKNRIIAEGISLPDVPAEVVAQFPRVVEAVAELEKYGYPILLKDASLGGRFPVMNVTLLNPRDGSAFCSFGAHPKFEVALERALTELLQGRALDKLDVFPTPSFDREAVADTLNLEAHFIDSNGLVHWDLFKKTPSHPFVHWDFKGQTTQEEFDALMAVFTAMKLDVYIADYEHLGVYGCRVLVPGMSEIYRVDDLVWENNAAGAPLRAQILGAHKLDEDSCAALLAQIHEAGYDDMLLVAHALGVIPDAGTTWAQLRVGELKAMLALAAGNIEEARAATDWCLHFAPLAPERRRLYLCLDNLLQIQLEGNDVSEYEGVMRRMYGAELWDRARALIAGKARFDGLHASSTALEGFEMHQKLLTSYEKLQAAKRRWWQRR